MFGRFRNRRMLRRAVRRLLLPSDPRLLNRTSQLASGVQVPQGESPEEPGLGKPMQASQPIPGSRLPADCPRCGAPVRSDEVEWIDDTSVECAYCGGVIS